MLRVSLLLLAALALATGVRAAPAAPSSDGLAGQRVEPAGWRLAANPAVQPALVGWSDVGGVPNQSVEVVAVRANGDLYVAGTFSAVGGVSTAPLYMVARYDGVSWTALGGANDWIFSLLVEDDGTVYAGGRFTQIGGVAATRIAYFSANTETWHPLGVGFNNPVQAIERGPDGCLYAAGGFRIVGDTSGQNLARTCVEEVWEYVGGGTNNTVYDLAFHGTTLYVGGAFGQVGSGTNATQVAQYDLQTGLWAPVGAGVTQVGGGPTVYAVAVSPSGELYAGGAFGSIGGVSTSAIARWDGSAWHALGSGLTGTTGGSNAVRALAFDGGGALYVGGSFTNAGAVAARAVARWTGTAWEALGAGVGNGTVQSLAVAFPYVYAGGGFSDMDGDPSLDFLARWEGGVASASEPEVPGAEALVLEAAAPNPFAQRTTLRFSAARPQALRLALYDALGRRVATLFEGAVAAGQVVSVAVDGQRLPAGLYTARLIGETGTAAQRLARLR